MADTIQEAPPITEEDIALLLASLGDESLNCEARHADNGNPCSFTVTHRERLTCIGEVRNVCTAEANEVTMWALQGAPCGHCGRPLSTCWIINPI